MMGQLIIIARKNDTFVGIVRNIKTVMHQKKNGIARRICSEHRGCFAQGHVGGGTMINESGILKMR